MATLTELEHLYEQLRSQYTDEGKILADLLKTEIKRRKSAGRDKTSNLSRKEQNRLAQQRFRANRKGLQGKPK